MKLCEANNGARNILEFYFAGPLSWFKNHPTLQLGILTKAPKVISSSSSSSTKRITLCFFSGGFFMILSSSIRLWGEMANFGQTPSKQISAHTQLTQCFQKCFQGLCWTYFEITLRDISKCCCNGLFLSVYVWDMQAILLFDFLVCIL